MVDREKIYGNVDGLTNLYNENYLKRQYSGFLQATGKTHFIMFDFKKFKNINDTYGHDMGDRYLILFAKVLKSAFADSLIIRLHGDEFCILTKYSEQEIIKRLEACKHKIEMYKIAGTIPEIFEFNAGIVEAEHSIQVTKNKADYMMYYAKKNDICYQTFSEEIWKIKADEQDFMSNIEYDIANDSLSYYKRRLFDLRENNKPGVDSINDIWEISTRNNNGDSILCDEYYQLLRESSLLRKIDMYNLEYLLPRVGKVVKGRIIINLDFKSLIGKNDLIEYLNMMLEIGDLKANDFILSINVNGIDISFYDFIIETLTSLKKLGFYICLDKYNSKIPDGIWENSNIDYLEIDFDYWKDTMQNLKSEALLGAKLKLFTEYSGLVPIFNRVSYEYEYEHILGMANNVSSDKLVLASGDYLQRDYKIKLR